MCTKALLPVLQANWDLKTLPWWNQPPMRASGSAVKSLWSVYFCLFISPLLYSLNQGSTVASYSQPVDPITRWTQRIQRFSLIKHLNLFSKLTGQTQQRTSLVGFLLCETFAAQQFDCANKSSSLLYGAVRGADKTRCLIRKRDLKLSGMAPPVSNANSFNN